MIIELLSQGTLVTIATRFAKWIQGIVGYYVWASHDNLEWLPGYGIRYGIIHVDFNSQNQVSYHPILTEVYSTNNMRGLGNFHGHSHKELGDLQLLNENKPNYLSRALLAYKYRNFLQRILLKRSRKPSL